MVPPAGPRRTSIVAPMVSALCRMVLRPRQAAVPAKSGMPTPSSSTLRIKRPSIVRSARLMWLALACFTALLFAPSS